MFARLYANSRSIDATILLQLSGLLTGSSLMPDIHNIESSFYSSSTAPFTKETDTLSLLCEVQRLKYTLKSVTFQCETLKEEIYKLLHVMSDPNCSKYHSNLHARAYELHYELLKKFLERERRINEQLSSQICMHKCDSATQTFEPISAPSNGISQFTQTGEWIQKGSDEILIISIEQSSEIQAETSEESQSIAWSTAETSPIPAKFIYGMKIDIDDFDGVDVRKPPYLDSKGSRRCSMNHLAEIGPVFRLTDLPLSTRGFSKDTISDESLTNAYNYLPNFSPISAKNPFHFYIDEDLEWSFNPKDRDFSLLADQEACMSIERERRCLQVPKPKGDQNSYSYSPNWSEASTPKLNSPETSYSAKSEECVRAQDESGSSGIGSLYISGESYSYS